MSRCPPTFRPGLEWLENRWCLHGGEWASGLELPEAAAVESHTAEPTTPQETEIESESSSSRALAPQKSSSPEADSESEVETPATKSMPVIRSAEQEDAVSSESADESFKSHPSGKSAPAEIEDGREGSDAIASPNLHEADSVEAQPASSLADRSQASPPYAGLTKEPARFDAAKDVSLESRNDFAAHASNPATMVAASNVQPASTGGGAVQVAANGAETALEPDAIRSLEPEVVSRSTPSATVELADVNQNQFAINLSAMELGLRRFLDQMENRVQELVNASNAHPTGAWVVGSSLGVGSAALAFYLVSQRMGEDKKAAKLTLRRSALGM
jgi:hypothetical protein